VAKAVARVHPYVMVVEANVAPVLPDKVRVVPKDKVDSEVRVVMARDKEVQVSVVEDSGAMNAARCRNAAKLRNRCPKSMPPSFPMRRA
jgi:hypothetical protein